MARTDHTEYGGGEGTYQRREDGSGVELSARQKAQILRSIGMHGATIPDASVVPGVDAAGDPEPAARTSARRLLEEKTNGYWRDPQIGGA